MENSNNEIFKRKAKEVYENCELTGIKILADDKEVIDNFGLEIYNIINENCVLGGKNDEGLKNEPKLAKYYLSQLVKIDAIEHEIVGQTSGRIDTNKKLDFNFL